MKPYKTLISRADAEFVINKSHFIGHGKPVESEEEALAFLAEMRETYKDATHNCYAYIVGANMGVMRYSDDGEPGGTSGQPTLNVFRQAGVCDVCCVVTRYFGGILLGSGGLVRAYSKAAALALEAAGRARMAEWERVELMCSYSQYERVRRLLEGSGAADIEGSFGEFVAVAALLPAGAAGEMERRLSDMTAGAAQLAVKGSVFRPQKMEG